MKARRLLPILAVVALVAAVAFLALRLGWFDTVTAPVILPETTALPTASGGGEPGGGPTLAEVTPETVFTGDATVEAVYEDEEKTQEEEEKTEE